MVGPGGARLPRFDRDGVAAHGGQRARFERVGRLQAPAPVFHHRGATAGAGQVAGLVEGVVEVVERVQVVFGAGRSQRQAREEDEQRDRGDEPAAPGGEADRDPEHAGVGEVDGEVAGVDADDALLVDREGGEGDEERPRPAAAPVAVRGEPGAATRASETAIAPSVAAVTFQGATSVERSIAAL